MYILNDIDVCKKNRNTYREQNLTPKIINMYMKNLEPQQALLREINHSNMFSQVYSQLPSLPTERIDCDFHASVIDRYGKDTNKQCKSKYEKLVILHVSKKETQKQTSITKSLCRVVESRHPTRFIPCCPLHGSMSYTSGSIRRI